MLARSLLIQKAQELIDMSKHTGEHPRMGSYRCLSSQFQSCKSLAMEETATWAHKLGERVGTELGIPGYHYEAVG